MTTRRRTLGGRAAACVVLSVAVLSACGLKPEIKDGLSTVAAPGQAFVDPNTGEVVQPNTGAVDPNTGQVVQPGTSNNTGTNTNSTGTNTNNTGTNTNNTGTNNNNTGTNNNNTGNGNSPVVKGNTTGIDDKNKVVTVVLHGPLTGAGVPQESFQTGGPKYWNGKKLKNGYTVRAEAVDDEYNAADAARVCAAAAKRAFLIIGGAGTDQISACAQQPNVRRGGVPYLSSGVTEVGLGKLPHYFANSLTYKQQSPLLIKMARDNGYLSGKWAVVITGTPNFADARDSFISELQKAGGQGSVGAFNRERDLFLTEKAPANCSTLSGQLRAGGYTSVYFLGQPSFFAQCVGQYSTPTYTGPGPSFGINTVANLACAGSGGAYKGYYLHPSPGLETAPQRAPGVSFRDDIEYGIYGGMEMLHKALDLVNGPLTRESFIAANQNAVVSAKILNPVDYRSGRFGGTAAYANKVDCGTRTYKTIAVYKKQ